MNISKQRILAILILHILINHCFSSLPENIANTSDECLTNSLETALYCRGSRAINNILNNLSKTNKPIIIVRGLEIVPTNHYNNETADEIVKNVNNKKADGNKEGDGDDDTFIGRFSRYLRSHELNIKFSDLMSSDESENNLAHNAEQDGMQINLYDEARKKDKGNTMIMVLGLMVSKMMAVMGLGGVGALALKALGIAMTALMMATMVGVKSMASQGNEPSHSVQYVTADGHHHIRRRRRSTGNTNIFSKLKSTSFKDNHYNIKLPSLFYKRQHLK